ncbi:MAG: histidinol-phosphate transaminase [Cycloclasticus sp.]|nr:histidinol-phosphate transaminase [Cycloclasticus sp.]MBQ0789842.1 histidinol-phosphate transaminase [Cycloclasticus sp.]
MQQKHKKIQQLIRPEIQQMQAYHVPASSGLVKLDAMENPFRWPEDMQKKWLELLSQVEPNRYPDPSAQKMVLALRECFKVEPQLGVLLGNGSDELIQLILMAMKAGSRVLAPAPSFVMYQQIAQALGMPFIGVPLAKDFELDVPAMLAAIKSHDPAVVFLAYPNNPTANLFNDEDLLAIIEASNGLVVIDEAYQPFAKKTFLNRVKDLPNVVVMRTVSKLGLAGLRLGFLVGDQALIEQLDKIRLPYNINVLTQVTARFAFEHIDVLDAQAEEICQQRELLLTSLNQFAQVQVFPSAANFILFALRNDSAARVFEALKAAGLLIKKMAPTAGLPENCLRVTVGLSEENQLFITQLGSILGPE